MLTASMDRLTDFFDERSGKPITEDRLTPLGRTRSFVLQTEFRAAENIPCNVLKNIIIRSSSGCRIICDFLIDFTYI